MHVRKGGRQVRSNIAIIGTSTKLNNAIGLALSGELDMNYMDYSEYVEYLTLRIIKDIEKEYGKAQLRKLYTDKLRSIRGYHNSIFAFAGGVCSVSSDVDIISKDAYVICLAPSRVCSKVTEKCLTVICTKDKKVKDIIDTVILKLGELDTYE